ncbi:DNA repair protein RAD26 [Histoplasma capsulatum H143]|uniref:DNA repair protein RAD26 n=1 Tax=Ajellomyces capsulatus (strain H143) TaxID=544712 RepID=C6HQU3_AJECH|nr:DNA repair protein RAD26 [Histoplasma capsulatum H143]
MDNDKDNDSFSDDGIDELPPGTLLELERNAYQASQPQRPDSRNRSIHIPPNARNPSFTSLARGAISRPASRTLSHGPVLQDPSRLLRPPLSFGDEDFEDLDAGVLDDGYGPAPVELQNAMFQQDKVNDRLRPGPQEVGPRPDHGAKNIANGNTAGPAAQHAVSLGDTIVMSGVEEMATDAVRQENGSDAPDSDVWVEIEAMKEQIEQLTRERERIAQELAAAKSMTEAKAGEIAIIRANQAKLEKAHSRQLSTLRTQMADELKKYQAEIEAATMDSKLLTTENAFLKQDLKDEMQKLNDLRKARAKLEENAPLTPKKTKILPLRDGFDDDEIMLSPTKSVGRRSKRGTPSVSGGRKRKTIDDSPVKAPTLELSQSFETNLGDSSESAELVAVDPAPRKPNIEDRNVRFIRRILNHKTYPSKGRDLEIFTKLSFPSDPGRMFSSFILEAATAKSSENYAVEYAKAIVSLWSRALKESFYDPIAMFMAIIKYIINLDPSNIVPQLIEDLLPVLLKSGYVNGVARFRNSPVSHQNLASSQPLRTPPIHPRRTNANENYIIDRVANLLSEQLYVDEGEKPYTHWKISTLRIEAMSFLTTLAFSSPHPSASNNHAGRLLARHPTALARVFRSIHDELDALYSNPPERELHVALVNGLTRLAYGIMRMFRDEVNVGAKLRVVPGATQKHLVALTRLAFCEGLLLEAGVEDDTVEMAHEMLEEAVNPQEAEALLEAFRVKSLE